MPIISTFFGIVVRMFYREHGASHFHAEYRGQQAAFTFKGKVLAGSLDSRTAIRLIRQWCLAHQTELEANWNRVEAGGTPAEDRTPGVRSA